MDFTMECLAKALGFITPNHAPNRFHANMESLRRDGHNPKLVGGDFVKIGGALLPKYTIENEPYIIIARMLESRRA